jgi:capsular exopolysaccharide synthesis family protein
MDFSKFLNIVRRYLWLLVLATLIPVLTTFYMLNNEPVSYRAASRLLVGPSLDSPSPDLNSLKIGGQLIQTYAEMVQNPSFLRSVQDKLDQKTDLDTLDLEASVRTNLETRIMTVVVRDPDPSQAVAIANAVAETFVEISPSKDNTTALLRTQMSSQTHLLENIISDAENSIRQLETELQILGSVPATTPEEQKAALDRQNLIVKQLAEERARLSDAMRTSAAVYQVLLDSNINQVEIIEQAESGILVDDNNPLRAATAGLAGLILAVGVIFVFEYFDDTIRFPGDFSKAAKVPLLSTINKHKHLRGSGFDQVVVFAQPNSLAAKGYHTAVAKLLFSISKGTRYTILLSSVGSKSGKDTATASVNLAVAFAQAGSRVVVVDGQLHNPILTEFFNADDSAGLADFLESKSTKPQLLPVKEAPDLRLLPVGFISEEGSGVALNSANIAKLLEEIKKDADIVLIAGSPISWFAESLTLASKVDGVILVARPGEAHGKIVNEVVENLSALNAHLSGVIFDYNSSSSLLKVSAVDTLVSSETGSIAEPAASTAIGS